MGNSQNTAHRFAFAGPFFSFGAFLFLVFVLTLMLSEVSHYYRSSSFDVETPAQLSFPKSASHTSVELAQGREDLAEILTATADFLENLSTKHHLHSLNGLSKDLRAHSAEAHKSSLIKSASTYLKGRGLLDGLAGLLGGEAGGTGGSSTSNPLTGAISSLLGGLGGNILDSLAGPAQYLGDGIGRGTASGLKLNTNAATTQTTAQMPTGINAIADNLGFGLANSLAESVNLSSLAPSTQTLADAGSALAMGLGGGAASGLKLNKSAIITPNMTGISLIANDFGSGLSQSFLGGVDLSKLTAGTNITAAQVSAVVSAAGKGLGSGAAEGLKLPASPSPVLTMIRKRQATGSSPPVDINTVAEDFTNSLSSSFLGSIDVKGLAAQVMGNSTGALASALVSAGSGLGSGAAVGLGLQKDSTDAAPTSTDVPAIARSFAFQLSTGFLENGTINNLQKAVTSSVTGNIMEMLGPAAQGAGSGIGQGVAVGFGLQGASTAPNPVGGDVAMVARDFSFGLTDSFLANGTAVKLVTIAKTLAGNSSTLNLQSVNVSKAAEGLARGLVDGAGESINNAGGFQAILNGGNATAIMADAISSKFDAGSNTFNDSVGGIATGFGRGLGGEGVMLVLQALGKEPVAAAANESTTTTATALATPSSSADNTSAVVARGFAPHIPRSVRIHTTIPAPVRKRAVNLSSLFVGANATAIDNILQKGTNALTCQGVGGLISILIGLKDSNTLPSTGSLNGTLPNINLTIMSDGNRFDINPSDLEIKVNGNNVIKTAILIIFHAFLVILAYFVAIPVALLIQNGRAIAVLIGQPDILANAAKWKMFIWGGVVMPLSLVGFILGVLILGDTRQFATAHGILGLIAFLITLLAGALELPMLLVIPKLSLIRGSNLGVLLGLSVALFITGFADISKVSLCLTDAIIPDVAFLVIGSLVMLSLVGGLTVVAMRYLIQRWVGRKRETPFWGADEKIGRAKIEIVRNVDD